MTDLYDHDYALWTREQAARLRDAAAAGVNLHVDWQHVAEEIEDIGRRERRELGNQLATIIEHLLKLEFSQAREPRDGWIDSIQRSRYEITLVLDDSPSLRREVAEMIAKRGEPTARLVADALGRRGEADRDAQERITARRHTVEQVVGDWFPT
jgi:hypothetical protein